MGTFVLVAQKYNITDMYRMGWSNTVVKIILLDHTSKRKSGPQQAHRHNFKRGEITFTFACKTKDQNGRYQYSAGEISNPSPTKQEDTITLFARSIGCWHSTGKISCPSARVGKKPAPGRWQRRPSRIASSRNETCWKRMAFSLRVLFDEAYTTLALCACN